MSMTTRYVLLAGILAISFVAGGAGQGSQRTAGASAVVAYLASIADLYNPAFAAGADAPVATALNDPPGKF